MLSQIVRPMVRTQIRLLANSQATHTTLVKTITQWLGFLGVQATVTQLTTGGEHIQVSLTVGKPEACDSCDWTQILTNLDRTTPESNLPSLPNFSQQQQRKLQRFMAYVIQIGNHEPPLTWDVLGLHLERLGFNEPMILGIRSAMKVPQSLEQLVEELDPDVAAIALPKVLSLVLLDGRVNPLEDNALNSLLQTIRQPACEL